MDSFGRALSLLSGPARNQLILLRFAQCKQLETSAKTKEEVVAKFTHDLRNPLNTINNILELIDGSYRKAKGDERYSKQL
ncbi:MAG: hypothetical protein IPP57_21095 [Candidatus Obscuribacter sp.]|nr:hypothetical protein [Candidatus Obscuribacter sp.]